MGLTPTRSGKMEGGPVSQAVSICAISDLLSPAQAHTAGLLEDTGSSWQAGHHFGGRLSWVEI